MKKIVLLLFSASLILSSCIQQMEETESTKIAGAWAVIGENNMVSRFLFFDKGYLYEYKSSKEYYLHDNVLWGAMYLAGDSGEGYRYSLVDGVLHYQNYYKDAHIPVQLEDNILILENDKYMRVDEVEESCFSRIILSQTNRTDLLYSGEEVEWEYEIENPVEGFLLTVKKAPEWCGGADGVTVDGGKIRFNALPTELNTTGVFVFSYLSAHDVKAEVEQLAPIQILLSETSNDLGPYSGYCSFDYTILNKREGVILKVTTDQNWISIMENDGQKISYLVSRNPGHAFRSGKITLTYGDVTAEFVITQE